MTSRPKLICLALSRPYRHLLLALFLYIPYGLLVAWHDEWQRRDEILSAAGRAGYVLPPDTSACQSVGTS